MFVLNIVILLASSVVLSLIAIPLIYHLLLNNNCIALNFRKQEIPIGMGLVFILVQTFVIFIYAIYNTNNDNYIFAYIISILIVGLVGIIDDLVGEKEIKGFKGHISSLMKFRLTTGGLKLLAGGASAFILSLTIYTRFIDFIINILLIALFTNLVNLFDLRPGRACKIFILISIVLIFSATSSKYNYILISLLCIVLIYMPYDLKAKAMMGDTGSNVLGMTLGAFCAGTQTFWIKIFCLFLLVVLHIVSEFYSISKIIEKNKLLCYIDKLGRK